MQLLPCTYLPHHGLESVVDTMIMITVHCVGSNCRHVLLIIIATTRHLLGVPKSYFYVLLTSQHMFRSAFGARFANQAVIPLWVSFACTTTCV